MNRVRKQLEEWRSEQNLDHSLGKNLEYLVVHEKLFSHFDVSSGVNDISLRSNLILFKTLVDWFIKLEEDEKKPFEIDRIYESVFNRAFEQNIKQKQQKDRELLSKKFSGQELEDKIFQMLKKYFEEELIDRKTLISTGYIMLILVIEWFFSFGISFQELSNICGVKFNLSDFSKHGEATSDLSIPLRINSKFKCNSSFHFFGTSRDDQLFTKLVINRFTIY